MTSARARSTAAIGQTLRGSLRFRVNDAWRQIVESNFGALLPSTAARSDHVRQFANVARPFMSYKFCLRISFNPGKVLLRFSGKPPQKIFSENGYILRSLNGGSGDGNDIQTIVEVLTESSFLDGARHPSRLVAAMTRTST